MDNYEFLDEKYFVSWHETDFQSKMTMKSICDNLMETAWKHAGKLGFGYEDLDQNEFIWILSRIYIEVVKYPVWKNNIRIRTWPVGIDKLFTIRHFHLFDEQGDLVARAGSYWLIVDKESHRPVRPEKLFGEKLKWTENKAVGEIDKIEVQTAILLVGEHKVTYSDIDYYKHVTNSKYTEFVMNCIPVEKFEQHAIQQYQVNFLAETHQDDKLDIFANIDFSFFKLLRTSDQKEVAHVKIGWH